MWNFVYNLQNNEDTSIVDNSNHKNRDNNKIDENKQSPFTPSLL